MWRKGWVDRIDNKGQEIRVSLCNACGLLWKRGWFCVHCECVYRKEDEKHKEEGAAGEMWIGCEYCENFSHFECEKNIEDAYCDSLEHSMNTFWFLMATVSLLLLPALWSSWALIFYYKR